MLLSACGTILQHTGLHIAEGLTLGRYVQNKRFFSFESAYVKDMPVKYNAKFPRFVAQSKVEALWPFGGCLLFRPWDGLDSEGEEGVEEVPFYSCPLQVALTMVQGILLVHVHRTRCNIIRY